ncbi:hypothetical protein KIN20_031488 [Parelaphostrongylus tenuis]|uniref:ShKT domain-containing protein n=1 Tax=Parelaphostrongylus tenuis TaxID=148309 RepID=A0AAD5R582_PARTN|nr:hypothetical protein KIN20_031488 [Parelaphostrongylus tenuis]
MNFVLIWHSFIDRRETTMLAYLSLITCFHLIQSQLQSCANGGIGPCVANMCPSPTATCITTANGQICCENSMIVNVTTTTPSTSTCVDLVNPRTGVSDCPNRANLCNNAVYFTLMTQQCPKTCNRCGNATAVAPACADLVNPRTGVSDCPRLQYLCNNSVYFTLMTQQCPRTCNRCPGTITTTPISTTVSNCRDLVNPTTGVSDCPRMASYCRNALYTTLMRQQCPRTCGYCV